MKMWFEWYASGTHGMPWYAHSCSSLYLIQKVTEIYNKVTKLYNFLTKFKNSSWNILCLLRSEVAYIGTGHILP
jgi:hypothetical protein